LLAHIPLWHVPKPERALVICFGMGTTFKSAAQYPDLTVESIELSPRVFDCFPYYHPDTSVGPDGKKWIWIANDGRNHLLMSDTRYDMITIDPPPPIYGAGTVNLYTREFYELAKSRLTEQGVLSQWFPSETLLFEMKMLVKTFRSVFPNTLMWRGPDGNGLFVIGAEHPLKIDYARIEESFRNPDILRDLTEWDALVNSPETTLDQFVMSGPRIDEFVGDVPIITDNNPYTEFPFTLHLLYGRSPRTWDAWDEILRYREPVDPYLINDTRGGTQAQEP
jgi:spermidine synthase